MAPLPAPVEAVIFDMDGLLLDSERLYRKAILESAAHMGFEFPDDFYATLVGIPGKECEILIQNWFGAEFPMAAFRQRCRSRLDLLFEPGIPLKAGASELLAHLDQRGLLKAVATSTGRRTAESHLQRAGVLHRFDALITRDETDHSKPHPDPYLKAAAKLGIAPNRCLTLEDSYNGVRSAHAAGTMTVMVPDLLSCTDELRGLCVAVVKDLHEVRDILLGS